MPPTDERFIAHEGELDDWRYDLPTTLPDGWKGAGPHALGQPSWHRVFAWPEQSASLEHDGHLIVATWGEPREGSFNDGILLSIERSTRRLKGR